MILKDMGNETGKKLEKAAMGKFKVERSCARCKVVINTTSTAKVMLCNLLLRELPLRSAITKALDYQEKGNCSKEDCGSQVLQVKLVPQQEPELLFMKINQFNLNTGKSKSQRILMKGRDAEFEMGNAVYKVKAFLAFSGESRTDGGHDLVLKMDEK